MEDVLIVALPQIVGDSGQRSVDDINDNRKIISLERKSQGEDAYARIIYCSCLVAT